MEYRNLEITGMSAKDINKVNLISKMDVYVAVSIAGGSKKDEQKKKTPVDNDGDTHPSWKIPMNFKIDESSALQNRLTLVFKLRCERALGDKDIGEVHVPIKELLDSSAGGSGTHQFVSYQVRKPNGKPKGQFTFSYKFAKNSEKAEQPVTAYPAMAGPSSVYPPPKDGAYPPAASSAAASVGYPQYSPEPPHKDGAGVYPPQPAYGAPVGYPQAGQAPQSGYGYAYPPPQAYGGYPPPPPHGAGYGYGYPPQQQAQGGYGGYPPVVQPAGGVKPPKKNKLGMGLGAGLLGGALGGLLIGDMVSDASSYDAGYGDGFGDAGFDGGFDF
jgi:hypothetical protein